MASWRVMVPSIPRSSLARMETTRPGRPHRPVRPARCIYASAEPGRDQSSTQSTTPKSSPRALPTVLTSTRGAAPSSARGGPCPCTDACAAATSVPPGGSLRTWLSASLLASACAAVSRTARLAVPVSASVLRCSCLTNPSYAAVGAAALSFSTSCSGCASMPARQSASTVAASGASSAKKSREVHGRRLRSTAATARGLEAELQPTHVCVIVGGTLTPPRPRSPACRLRAAPSDSVTTLSASGLGIPSRRASSAVKR
mmetsp:Transcript_16304/g.34970  ORF Transcript_16304/g.34970 Transcript_16304/m.34970 type:complete len:258 (+) Transcript_16304:486-1259(+)